VGQLAHGFGEDVEIAAELDATEKGLCVTAMGLSASLSLWARRAEEH